MDLTRVSLIRDAPKESLTDSTFLESFIPTLGFNKEVLHEQPEIVKRNGGGLLIWQYPNQFSCQKNGGEVWHILFGNKNK